MGGGWHLNPCTIEGLRKRSQAAGIVEVVQKFPDCVRLEVLTVASMNFVLGMTPCSLVNATQKSLVMVD